MERPQWKPQDCIFIIICVAQDVASKEQRKEASYQSKRQKSHSGESKKEKSKEASHDCSRCTKNDKTEASSCQVSPNQKIYERKIKMRSEKVGELIA